VVPEPKLPLQQPGNAVGQHLNGSNNSGGFDGQAVEQEIMEMEGDIGLEWKAVPNKMLKHFRRRRL